MNTPKSPLILACLALSAGFLHADTARTLAEGSGTEAAAAAASPEALLKALYGSKKTAFSPAEDRKTSEQFLSSSLIKLLVADAKKHAEEPGPVDFDPLTDSQDAAEVKKLAMKAETSGEKSTVVVTFEYADEARKLTFLCVKEEGKWKVNDIGYGEGRSLAKLLSAD